MSEMEGSTGDFLSMLLLAIFVGSFVGSMAQVMPYPVTILSGIAFLIVLWIDGTESIFAIMLILGVLIAAVIGTMGSVIALGLPIFMALSFAIVILRRTRIRSNQGLGNMVVIPLLILIAGGLFYNFTYPDFCLQGGFGGSDVCNNPANWVQGFPTIWTGCISTCGFGATSPSGVAFAIFGSSVLGNAITALFSGDVIGFFSALFTAPQTAISVGGFLASIAMLAAGLVLLLLSLGIGFSANVLASGGSVTTNPAGTWMSQSFAIGLIVFGLANLAFLGWITSVFGGGLLNAAFGASFILMLYLSFFIGLYLNGKSIGL